MWVEENRSSCGGLHEKGPPFSPIVEQSHVLAQSHILAHWGGAGHPPFGGASSVLPAQSSLRQTARPPRRRKTRSALPEGGVAPTRRARYGRGPAGWPRPAERGDPRTPRGDGPRRSSEVVRLPLSRDSKAADPAHNGRGERGPPSIGREGGPRSVCVGSTGSGRHRWPSFATARTHARTPRRPARSASASTIVRCIFTSTTGAASDSNVGASPWPRASRTGH